MTTAATTSETVRPSLDDAPAVYGERGALLLDDVSWELYERLLDETQHQNIRMTYDEGRLFLMSPLPRHERVKGLTGRLIELATLERGIPIAGFGSTTWRRRELRKGLEADECYYIQHALEIGGRSDIDLKRDPPPDLAVEVYISYNPLNRPSVYSKIGVPEIWRFAGDRFEFLVRSPGGDYERTERSVALPFFTPEEVTRFVRMLDTMDEHRLMLAFRDWIRALP